MDKTMHDYCTNLLIGGFSLVLVYLLPLHRWLTDPNVIVGLKVLGFAVSAVTGGFLTEAGKAAYRRFFPDADSAKIGMMQRWKNRRRRTELNLKD